MAQLSRRLASLRSKYKERGAILDKWIESQRAWKARCKQLEKDIEGLRVEVDASADRAERYESAYRRAAEELSQLKSRYETLKVGNTTMRRELEDARSRIEVLEERLKTSRETMEELRNPPEVFTIYHCRSCSAYGWASHPRDDRPPEANHECERKGDTIQPLEPERTDPSEDDIARLEREWDVEIEWPDEEE